MADLKSLAGMQIGGSRYPDKKRINLYQREYKKSTIALQLLLFGLFWVFLYCFVQLGVVQPLQQAEHAELVYQNMAVQLETMKEANSIMDEVSLEYAHYGSSFRNETELATPDRIMMLNTLETSIFPKCKSISSVSINLDTMNIECILPQGTVLSELVKEIEQDENVRYASASVEATQKDETGNTNTAAAEKEVTASLTVLFKVPGESGEES